MCVGRSDKSYLQRSWIQETYFLYRSINKFYHVRLYHLKNISGWGQLEVLKNQLTPRPQPPVHVYKSRNFNC